MEKGDEAQSMARGKGVGGTGMERRDINKSCQKTTELAGRLGEKL